MPTTKSLHRPTAEVGASTLWRCGGRTCPAGTCDHDDELQRHAAGPAPGVAPPIVHEVLGSSGSPLPSGVRQDMERRLGHDFASVRVHSDAKAAASARAVNARAYTVGRDIVFGTGQFQPHSAAGAYVLAHELAHAAEARSGPSRAASQIRVGAADDQAEVHADQAALAAMKGEPLSPEPAAISAPRQAGRGQAGPGQAGPGAAGTLRRIDSEDCSTSQIAELTASLPIARAMVNKAMRVLGQPLTAEVSALMRKYFVEASVSTQLHALIGYTALKSGLGGSFTFECEEECDDAYAYVYALWSDVHMCPAAFGRSPELLARTIVHESSHKFDSTDDEEYCYTGCNSISRWEAYDNADSYARFAWEAYTTLP